MQLFKQGSESIRGRIFPSAATATTDAATEAAQPEAPATVEPPSEGPIWQPTATSSAHRLAIAATIPNECALLAACMRPADPDDGHRASADKKERELAALFDQLTSAEALALHRRLANPQPPDALAMAFDQRIAIERRKRLLAYLGSAKRRAALGR